MKIKIKRKLKENKLSDKVHAKAAKIHKKEGVTKDQAYAIAASMEERGELEEGSTMDQYHPDPVDDKTGANPLGAGADPTRVAFYNKFRDIIEDATVEIYDTVTPQQMLDVLAQDEAAAARVQGAANIQASDKKILMQMIEQAKSGAKGMSDEQRQVFFEFLIATATEFGLHGTHVASEYSHQGHSGRVIGRKRRMQFALKDMIYAHLYKYLRDPSGSAPSDLSFRWSQQAKDYGETGDLPDIVYNLRENWKKFIKS